MPNVDSNIRMLLSQAYILGGSPCSGKSTLTERLSSQYALHYYKVDDHEQAHAERCRPERHPTMFKYSKMGWNEIWSRPVALQVQDELAYYHERFEMIVEDLERYEAEKPLILEGAAYLPDLIAPYAVNPIRVLYLVPTKEFQVRHYQRRPWIHHILKECADPQEAFARWMARDHLFGQEILRQAQAHAYRTLVVDGQLSLDELFEKVKESFGFG